MELVLLYSALDERWFTILCTEEYTKRCTRCSMGMSKYNLEELSWYTLVDIWHSLMCMLNLDMIGTTFFQTVLKLTNITNEKWEYFFATVENILTWVLASDTDPVFVESAQAFLYLSIVPLTL